MIVSEEFEMFVQRYRRYLGALEAGEDDRSVVAAQVELRASYSDFAGKLLERSGWTEPLLADLSEDEEDEEEEEEEEGEVEIPPERGRTFVVTVSVALVDENQLDDALMRTALAGVDINAEDDVRLKFQNALGVWISDLHARTEKSAFGAETTSAWVDDSAH